MPPTVADLYQAVLNNHEIKDVKDKLKLLNEIRKLNTAEGDRWVYRPVAYMLGAMPLVLVMAYAVGWLTELNAGLLSLASAAVGALATFLTTGVASTPPVGSTPPEGTASPAGSTSSAGTTSP